MNLTSTSDIVSEGWHRLVHLSRFDLTQFFATLCKMNMQIRFAVNKVGGTTVVGFRLARLYPPPRYTQRRIHPYATLGNNNLRF